MISPGTDASGSSLPSTAHSISRASGTALRPRPCGRTRARASIARRELGRGRHLRDADARAEVGRLHEQRQAERERRRDHLVARARPSRRATNASRRRPAGRAPRTAPSSRLVHADRRGQHAAADVGTLASSSRPWTVPSSPYGPCSTGKMTSRPSPVTTAAGSAAPARPAAARSVSSVSSLGCARATRFAAGARGARRRALRACSITSAAESAVGGRSASIQRPSFSMRIGNRLVARAIEVLDDRRRRRERHFVLARSSAVDDADAQLLHAG